MDGDTNPRDLRAELKALGISQAQIARESDIHASVLSQWMGGTYPGDNAGVERKLAAFLAARRERALERSRAAAAPEWIDTPTSRRILTALTWAQAEGDIAVIYGSAGAGKTRSIQHYHRTAPAVWVATMTPSSAGVAGSLAEIAEAIGLEASGSPRAMFKSLCKRLKETNGLVIIDEAQHLGVQALDQIRAIHDETGIGIALVGNEAVYARMTGGNRAAYLDRLYSRIGNRVRISPATQADLQAVATAWGLSYAPLKDLLTDIAGRGGAIRAVTKVLRRAAAMAAAAGEPIGQAQIAAAWKALGGDA
jgi:DNA transposition AAA+ family ATPase